MNSGFISNSTDKIRKQYWLLLGMLAPLSVAIYLLDKLMTYLLPMENLGSFATSIHSILIAIFSSLFAGALLLGLADTFLHVSRREDVKYNMLFSRFKTDYGRSVGLYLLMYFKILLWTLLLFIPGFVMSYAYKMSYYVAIEKPHYTPGDAIYESIQMMRGHKGELFGLHLSLILYYIPAIVFFVLAVITAMHDNMVNFAIFTMATSLCALLVSPLVNMINADFYEKLKSKDEKSDVEQLD